ncbi:hypothetical protein JCM18909_2147 [Cutibacterium acnes JCM 18909]|nr:hypothetical protein JCM18909_2147 [Cutibacterium acnes JCM 18909]
MDDWGVSAPGCRGRRIRAREPQEEEKKGSDEKSTAHVLFFAERGPPIETVRKFRE